MEMPESGSLLTVSAPAKVNLNLFVTGQRADGFHDLVSVVVPWSLADTLHLEVAPAGVAEDRLDCVGAPLLCGNENLVLRALQAFREQAPLPPLRISLHKRIPVGAGLGGGSSDAVAALRVANALSPSPLALPALAEVAARIGSDCPLFLANQPVVLRGRGERITPLPEPVRAALQDRPLYLVYPGFPIETKWAFQALAKSGKYDHAEDAEDLLRAWVRNPRIFPMGFHHNRFWEVVARRHRVYSAFAETLGENGWPPPVLTGSGSALYVLPEKLNHTFTAFAQLVDSCFGKHVYRVRGEITQCVR